MEVRNGLVERFRGEIPEQLLEAAKGLPCMVEMGGVLHNLVGLGPLNKLVSTPYLTIFHHVYCPFPGRDEVEGFPLRITAVLHNLPAQMGRDRLNVGHHFLWVFKDVLIDPLQDVSHLRTILYPAAHHICVVDMPALAEVGLSKLP